MSLPGLERTETRGQSLSASRVVLVGAALVERLHGVAVPAGQHVPDVLEVTSAQLASLDMLAHEVRRKERVDEQFVARRSLEMTFREQQQSVDRRLDSVVRAAHDHMGRDALSTLQELDADRTVILRRGQDAGGVEAIVPQVEDVSHRLIDVVRFERCLEPIEVYALLCAGGMAAGLDQARRKRGGVLQVLCEYACVTSEQGHRRDVDQSCSAT